VALTMALKTRSPRFQTERLPVMIRPTGTFTWNRGTVLNLSATGIQIFASTKFEVGVEVEMEFLTINKQGRKTRRKMRAKIVWQQGSRYGCQFTRSSRA
jgi:hypothetical protein